MTKAINELLYAINDSSNTGGMLSAEEPAKDNGKKDYVDEIQRLQKELKNKIGWVLRSSVLKDSDAQYMAAEYISQAQRFYKSECLYRKIPDEYYKLYKDDDIYAHVLSFTDVHKFIPLGLRDEKYLDAYTDLELFQYIEDSMNYNEEKN